MANKMGRDLGDDDEKGGLSVSCSSRRHLEQKYEQRKVRKATPRWGQLINQIRVSETSAKLRTQ